MQFGGHNPPASAVLFIDDQAPVTFVLVPAASPHRKRFPRRSSDGEKAEVGEAMAERRGELVAKERRRCRESHWWVGESGGGEVGFHLSAIGLEW